MLIGQFRLQEERRPTLCGGYIENIIKTAEMSDLMNFVSGFFSPADVSLSKTFNPKLLTRALSTFQFLF